MTVRSVLFCLLVALLPAACATQPQTAADSPERAVEQTFRTYRSALLASDGDVAAGLVTGSTLAYYRGLADRALTADRAALMEEHVVDRIGILLLRQDVPPERLRLMTGREVFAHAVDRGWISKDSTSRLRLTNYRVNGFGAVAQVVGRDGEPSEQTIEFHKEEGSWRLNVAHMVTSTRSAMKLAIALSGMTETELVNQAIERGTGRPPSPDIWNPPS